MKMVKMFDAREIQEETGIDVLEVYWNDVCNDSAIRWWIKDDDDDDDDDEEEIVDLKKIDSYLLAHGATLGEVVWIDIY